MDNYSDLIDTLASGVFATVNSVGTTWFIINLGSSRSLALIG